jgi:peroxiredoxin
MMKPFTRFLFALAILPSLALADAVPGKPAPTFETKDAQGKTRKLSDYKGKWLVLEWYNKDCPYVKKHYESGNMQKLQKTYTDKGVVWLSVISSAKGKQGYLEPSETIKNAKSKHSAASAILLDPSGKMGKAYGAKTTPHMFVINPKGEVAYAGAIDNNDSSDPAVIPESKNYVAAALDEGVAGKPIETPSSRSYGCGVKYAD